MSLVVRNYNGVVHAFLDDPASFEPVFRRGAEWGAAEWCEGFILGFQFADEAWELSGVAYLPGLLLSCVWAPAMASR